MVIMVTSNTGTNEPINDSRFKENLRSQLQEREARSPEWYKIEAERQAAEEDAALFEAHMSIPFVRTALKWIGGTIGTLLFTFGLLWFLSFFGLVLPWYVVFPLLIMIVGGAFIVAAATRKRR